MRRFRGAGKRVVSVLLRADATGCPWASAANQVFAVPEALLAINGLSASATLFGGTSEWAGVQWDVARQGAYKTAPEQLTNTEVSPAQRETLNALLDDQSRALEQALAEARSLSVEQVREALAQGLLPAERAKANRPHPLARRSQPPHRVLHLERLAHPYVGQPLQLEHHPGEAVVPLGGLQQAHQA